MKLNLMNRLMVLGLCFEIIGCQGAITANPPSATQTPDNFEKKLSSVNKSSNNFEKKTNSDQDCAEWEKVYRELDQTQKKILDQEGIILEIGEPEGGKFFFLISERVIKDCQLRIDVGKYIHQFMGRKEDEAGREFAHLHSPEIVEVIRRIWSAPHFSDGGISEDKYTLLANEGIDENEIAPFIKELIKKEGLKNLFWGLKTRRYPTLEPAVREVLKKAEADGALREQIYALILLYQGSKDVEYLSKLQFVAQSKKLKLQSQKSNVDFPETVSKIIQNLKNNEELKLSDVDDLLYLPR